MVPQKASDRKKKRGRPQPKIKVSRIEWTLEYKGKIIFIISLCIAIVFFILYIISAFKDGKFDLVEYGNYHYLSLGIIIFSGPYGMFLWYEYRVKLKQEEKFADFLRDLAEYWKVGLSMTQAINTLSRGEYGILNKEIKKMGVQLSWGMAFNDVLLWLADTLNTKLVHRSISLILEANKAGGKISDVLLTAARDTNEIRWIKLEREKNMKMYVVVIYIAFFVYLAVIMILVTSFLPSIINATKAIQESSGGQQPSIAGLQIRLIDEDFVIFVFYWSVIVQAVGNGLMAGTMGYGKTSTGLGHVFVMVLLSWLLFTSVGLF